MKKIMMMAVAALMATSIQAQPGYDDTKHEIAVTYGVWSNSQWIDVFEDAIMAGINIRYGDDSFVGPISAEYFYHAKKWLGVGGIFAYGNNKQDTYDGKKKPENYYGKSTNTYFTLMPAAKFDWLRSKNFGLYSKLAFGATLRKETIKKSNPDHDDYDETAVHVNWQVSALGIEAGSPKVRGFAELGFGEQGILLAGVRCKF